jgi:hypothetical protein
VNCWLMDSDSECYGAFFHQFDIYNYFNGTRQNFFYFPQMKYGKYWFRLQKKKKIYCKFSRFRTFYN